LETLPKNKRFTIIYQVAGVLHLILYYFFVYNSPLQLSLTSFYCYFMQRFLLISSFFLLTINTLAQQKPQYSQYMLNGFVLNPAIAGIEDYTDVKACYRNQWTDFPGSPKTFTLSAHTSIGKPDRTSVGATPNVSKTIRRPLQNTPIFSGIARVPGHHGVGITISSDHTGPNSQNSISLVYAYHLPVSGTMKFAVGTSLGVTQHTLNFDDVTLRDPNDPAILTGKINAIQPQINIGAWLYSREFYLGFSMNQLIFENFNYNQPDVSNNTRPWLGTNYQHTFLTAGYRIEPSDTWAIVPSVLVKRVTQAPLSVDINAKFIHNDSFWFGASYRNKDAFVGLIGVNLNGTLNLGYSYDYVLSDINVRARGTHEIVVGIMLNNRHKIVCPQNIW
jgi:type IX secretion system PorP/SprF family membrane protein